jgi:hypothetical protein
MTTKCFQCGNSGTDMYGYTICDACKSKLGLFSDETIEKHCQKYETDPDTRSYEEEIKYRLKYIETDYIKKKIKLLHILSRLQ